MPSSAATRSSKELSLLANLWFARPVGHTIEALRWCLGHTSANPRLQVSLVLNSDTSTELAACCPFIERTYAVDFAFSRRRPWTYLARPLDRVPRTWDYVLDSWRAHEDEEREHFPVFARYVDASNLRFQARLWRGIAGEEPPPYIPHQQLSLELPASSRERARQALDGSRTRIAVTPSGGTYERSTYPSVSSWETILDELLRTFPDLQISFIGKLNSDRRSSTVLHHSEHARLLAGYPKAMDCFDWPLVDQLAIIEASNLFVSPHTGLGMAAMAVATPWLVISGGQWYEYFCNNVPFYSVLPDPSRYPAYGFFEKVPVLGNDGDDEGPRTPSMTRARIVEDLPELLTGAQVLIDGSLSFEDAAGRHFRNLLAHFDGDASMIDSFDDIHERYI